MTIMDYRKYTGVGGMTKNKSWRTKRVETELVPAEGLSEEEIERRWNRIFEILEKIIRECRS